MSTVKVKVKIPCRIGPAGDLQMKDIQGAGKNCMQVIDKLRSRLEITSIGPATASMDQPVTLVDQATDTEVETEH